MSDIKRYDVDINWSREDWCLEEFEVGDVVKYEDHAAIVAQLEQELAKVTARYNCVRDMTPEDFGDLSTINNDFDSQVDAMIKSQQDHIPDVGQMVQSQAQQEPVSQWQPIETAPKNKKIIVCYKNSLGTHRTVFAKYIEKFTEESTCDTECETDYCEDDDTFYLKEGWVELIDNWDEFSSVYFDSSNVPTHWMPLPPAPEGDKR